MRRVLVELVVQVRRHEHALPPNDRGVERRAKANYRVGVEVGEWLVEKDEWDLLRFDARERCAAPLPRG